MVTLHPGGDAIRACNGCRPSGMSRFGRCFGGIASLSHRLMDLTPLGVASANIAASRMTNSRRRTLPLLLKRLRRFRFDRPETYRHHPSDDVRIGAATSRCSVGSASRWNSNPSAFGTACLDSRKVRRLVLLSSAQAGSRRPAGRGVDPSFARRTEPLSRETQDMQLEPPYADRHQLVPLHRNERTLGVAPPWSAPA